MGDSNFPENNGEGMKLHHCTVNRVLFHKVDAPAQIFAVVKPQRSELRTVPYEHKQHQLKRDGSGGCCVLLVLGTQNAMALG